MEFLILAALLLNAADDTASVVDLTAKWRFQPDPRNAGVAAQWFSPHFADAAWTTIAAGKRWEEQGFPELDGYAWYRRVVDVPSAWRGKRAWLVLGGVNDACTVYCNGRRVNSYGDEKVHSVNATPLVLDLTQHLRFGETNLLAVQVLDWGASGGLWQTPCLLTNDPARLPPSPPVVWFTDLEAQALTVQVDATGLGNDRGAAVIHVTLARPDTKETLVTRAIDLPKDTNAATVTLELAPVLLQAAGKGEDEYTIHVAVTDAAGERIGGAGAAAKVKWPAAPAWAGEYSGLKVLNNFVTELLRADAATTGSASILAGLYAFGNPRTGWVFFSLDPPGAGAETPRLFLNDETIPLVWRANPDSGALEAMRFLDEGKHRLRLEGVPKGVLDVRTVPELAYCYYLANPHIAAQGAYDRPFLERHVLSHVNTLVASGTPPQDDFQGWLREGRRWLANAALPGISSPTAPSPDEVYSAWAANPGTVEPGYAGLIVDEFINAGAAHYQSWTEAVNRLYGDPNFAGRVFYAWCLDMYRQPQCVDFSNALLARKGRFVWEVYLAEQPDHEKAQLEIRRALQASMNNWQAKLPGAKERLVVCLGYLCAPPESLNVNPAVDYNVYLDMQMRVLATAPEFWGVYGVMQYSASYADEEALRWAHRLFRHYCIEGRTAPLIDSPYGLTHLRNPDFEDGTKGWHVEAAAPDSIAVKSMEGLSWLQGRYPRTARGDQHLAFRRSEKAPNRVSQTVRNLEPGRSYSLKLLAADMQKLDLQQTLGLTVALEGVEMDKDLSFQYAYPSNYAHVLGPYNRDHPAWLTYYRLVFRAKSAETELTISDWAGPTKPGGPAGQEIGFNFVEVQPYLKP